jgi:hypothetical protein
VKYRPVDYRKSPILSLIRMNRKLIQIRKNDQGNDLFPNSKYAIVSKELTCLKPNSYARERPKYDSNKKILLKVDPNEIF